MAGIRLYKGELQEELNYHQQALECYEQLQQALQRSSCDDQREVAAVRLWRPRVCWKKRRATRR